MMLTSRSAVLLARLAAKRSTTALGAARPRFASDSSKSPYISPLSFGGHVFEEKQRNLVRNEMLAKLGEIPPDQLKFDAGDILPLNPTICFVQSGLNTLSTTWHKLFAKGSPACPVVAIVRDVFDLDPGRPTLKDTMQAIKEDVVVVNENIFDPLRRRLVNEYTLQPDGTRTLTRHDIDLPTYLHQLGVRVVTAKDLTTVVPGSIIAQQSTNHVLMVSPVAFSFNAEAAHDNSFIKPVSISDETALAALRRKVRSEFAKLYTVLTDAGMQVQLFARQEHVDTPDAVFPNNWFSTHTDFEVDDCTLVLYPMKVPNRRFERRPDYIDRVLKFRRYTRIIDLSDQEKANEPRFLEGTGSLVLDRIQRVAYVAISERSNDSLARQWCRLMNYTLVPFLSLDSSDKLVYHTNVVMSVGTKYAIVCLESVRDPEERARLLTSLSEHHEVIDITWEQVEKFCGNVLELEDHRGRKILAMSTRAFNAFTSEQKSVIDRCVHKIIHADISTIEDIGGGGVRCTIAELF